MIVISFGLSLASDIWMQTLDNDEFWKVYFRIKGLLELGLLWNVTLMIMTVVYKMCIHNKLPLVTLLASNLVTQYYANGTMSEESFLYYNQLFTWVIMVPAFIMTILLLYKKI